MLIVIVILLLLILVALCADTTDRGDAVGTTIVAGGAIWLAIVSLPFLLVLGYLAVKYVLVPVFVVLMLAAGLFLLYLQYERCREFLKSFKWTVWNCIIVLWHSFCVGLVLWGFCHGFMKSGFVEGMKSGFAAALLVGFFELLILNTPPNAEKTHPQENK